MDRVRFGRALGVGARHAMKTLVTAVDAATAENPSTKAPRPSAPVSSARSAPTATRTTGSPVVAPKTGQVAAKKIVQAREVRQGVRRGTKRFGEAIWSPFVRLSGVLWLEVTGVFFGIFALTGLVAVWRLRGEWRLTSTNAHSHQQLLGAVGMLAVFGYFCVSSFVRAKRRERRR